MSAIAMAALTFGYGAVPTVSDVDLQVESGSVTAIIGPSGCGKTTLLRLIAGFERPQSGTIVLGDRVVASEQTCLTPDRRKVGIVPQEGALFPHLSIAENVGFGLGRRDPDRRPRIAELIRLAGLTGLEDRHPRELSGGQQQRVALARALAPRPEVVLLDEPFASLDQDTRLSVRRAVAEVLSAEGATTVLVTHDREEALSMADQVAVMVAGRILQVGAPVEVYDAPVSGRVAALLGEVSLLPVRRVSGDRVETALGWLQADGPIPAGETDVLLRPERLEASAVGVETEVVAADFVGADTRVQLRLGDGTLVAGLLRRIRPRPGETVLVQVPGRVRVTRRAC